MATGRRAFHGKSAIDTLAAIIKHRAGADRADRAAGARPLRWVVERCLSKEPSNRYASTQDLAQELRVLRDHVTDISGTTAAGRKERRRRRAREPADGGPGPRRLAGMYLAGKRAGPDADSRFSASHVPTRMGRLRALRARRTDDRLPGRSFDRDARPVFFTTLDRRSGARRDFGFPEARSPLGSLLPGRACAVTEGGNARARSRSSEGAHARDDRRRRTRPIGLGGKGLLISARAARSNNPIGKVLFETSDLIRSPRLLPFFRGGRDRFS
jgi:hypothetical protein